MKKTTCNNTKVIQTLIDYLCRLHADYNNGLKRAIILATTTTNPARRNKAWMLYKQLKSKADCTIVTIIKAYELKKAYKN